MTPERHERARELFLAACELPEDRRASYLAHHCGDDGELRHEVESLLAYHDVPNTALPEESEGSKAVVIGRFRILERLGKGGMGEVFLARDPRLGRQVALKALPVERAADPEARRRLESEARSLAALNHPHVAALYALEEIDDRLYLVLEHVRGETLAARLKRAPLPLREALTIAVQIASGLEAAHAAGVIHRDLKPLNVMITPAGEAKVLDFGLAKRRLVGTAESSEEHAPTADPHASTRPGVILGTPAYLSPEQARGQPLDATTDLWAFGCLLFECLAGEQAFDGETFSDTLARILEGEPDWSRLPASLPPSVKRLLRRCLAKDHRRRLQHPGDARLELEEALELLSSPTALAERSAQKWRRLAWRLTAVGLLAVAGTIGFWIARRISPPTPLASPERRLSIRLPEEHPLALAGASPLAVPRLALALSPEGDHLVWVAASDEGSHLMHRTLDRFRAEPLPGTEGAFGPFFSPDGEWVGFFTIGHLRKVPLRGGTASSITEARNPYGAAWSEDGTIYFIDAEGSELVSVKDDGRDRGVLPLTEKSFWPQTLPDGRGLLLSGPVSVFDPRTGDLRPVVDAWFARYLDTGHLLYLQAEGNLLLAPFALDTFELSGPPIPVLEDAMGAVGSAMQLSVARGGMVAYLPGPQVIARSLIWADGDRLVPVAVDVDAYGALALSPRGDRLAIEIKAPGPDIWVFDLARGSSLRLTRGGLSKEPIWSVDGEEVFFCALEDGNWRAMTQRADGTGKPRRLLDDAVGCPVAVSPDGRWLVVSTIAEETAWDLHLASLSEPGPLRPFANTPAYEWGGRISPDGRWLAYTSDASGRYEVYLRSFPDGEKPRQVSTVGGEEPVWRSDGRAVVYRNGNRFMSVPFAADDEPRLGLPELIVEGDFFNQRGYSYDIAPGDARLLLLRAEIPATAAEIRLVASWIAAR